MVNRDRVALRMASRVALWSKDPSTQVGCAIFDGDRLVSTGWNDFAEGVGSERWWYESREIKYNRIVHAEAAALLRSRCNVSGMTMASTLCPCERCVGLIVMAGISRLVMTGPDEATHAAFARWGQSYIATLDMLQRAGVAVIQL